MHYMYTCHGTDGDGNTWSTDGEVEVDNKSIISAIDRAMTRIFMTLTSGEAIYGRPGHSCRGPYSILRFEIKKAD